MDRVLIDSSLLNTLSMLCIGSRCRLTGRLQYLRRYSTAKGAPVVLRPYQESCLDACLDALRSGCTRIGVSLPTGSGKTTVFISLLSRIFPPAGFPDASRSLIVVNSIELARQAAAQAEKLCPNWTVEIEQGAKHRASGSADVYVLLIPPAVLPHPPVMFNWSYRGLTRDVYAVSYFPVPLLLTRRCCSHSAWPSLTPMDSRPLSWTRHIMPLHPRKWSTCVSGGCS